jgi:hypothetical protein
VAYWIARSLDLDEERCLNVAMSAKRAMFLAGAWSAL